MVNYYTTKETFFLPIWYHPWGNRMWKIPSKKGVALEERCFPGEIAKYTRTVSNPRARGEIASSG
jgi:hypothetical protein